MKKTISLVLVLALGLATEVANADFTFDTLTNLGPRVNSTAFDGSPDISADGLSLYFDSLRPDGLGNWDIWVTTAQTTNADWGTPVSLPPPVNSSSGDSGPCISADGLSLFFASDRPGGFGSYDLWVTTRLTTEDPWEPPVNLGLTVNSWAYDNHPSISADALSLYFDSSRFGGYGSNDLWVTTRKTTQDPWEPPVNLGPTFNTSNIEYSPNISNEDLTFFFDSRIWDRDIWVTTRRTADDDWGTAENLGPPVNTSYIDTDPSIWVDGSTLYFVSNRPGGFGSADLWQVSISPVVDFNGDGIVDCADICIMVDHWGTDEKLCDIGPTPFGDGIVDVQDMIVLAEHLFEGIPPVEPEEVNVDEEDDGSQVELEQGQILVVTLESNPTTGYRWEQIEAQESILQQMGEAEFKPSETGEPPLVGAGGWEIFRFKAISAGQMTLQLVYHRPWEEGVEPLKTFSLQVVTR
jgi:predicted secreted protein